MISILTPTRKRLPEFVRMLQSIRDTASNPSGVEVVAYLDEDDPTDYEHAWATLTIGSGEPAPEEKYFGEVHVVFKRGPRIVLSKCWNECFRAATGDILMQGNDDIVFRTPGWDRMVTGAFSIPDKILMVHGNDGSGPGFGSGRGEFAPHPFLHRQWVETLGYFTAGYFSSDYGDTWINDLANQLHRRRYMPFTIEHMHMLFGKAKQDQTTSERLERHGADKVEVFYKVLAPLRRLDVAKLQRRINGLGNSKPKWSILILTQPSRAGFLARLLAVIEPQLQNHPDVELKIRTFDRTMDLGSNRQAMIDEAAGEYVNFIDDDDLVPADYVNKIYPLLDGVDYIGFRLQMDIDGVNQNPTFHSLRYSQWNGDADGWYRDISHINPIRKNLTITVTMGGGHGEDARWAEDLRKTGTVKTEHFLDEVMYFYHFRSNKTDQAPWFVPAPQTPRAEPNFYAVGHRRPECPKCKSTCCGIGGGLRICNQCGATWT